MTISFSGNHIKGLVSAATVIGGGVGVTTGTGLSLGGVLSAIGTGATAIITAPALPFILGGAAVAGGVTYAVKKSVDNKKKNEK